MKLWEKQIEFDPQRTKGLLYKMASDMFISQLRKDKVASTYTSAIELKLEQQDPLATLQYKELKDRYEIALVSLPEKQRTVFLMNRIEELTYKEISERLDLSIKAVEKRMTQALSELRKNLLTHE